MLLTCTVHPSLFVLKIYPIHTAHPHSYVFHIVYTGERGYAIALASFLHLDKFYMFGISIVDNQTVCFFYQSTNIKIIN